MTYIIVLLCLRDYYVENIDCLILRMIEIQIYKSTLID